MLPSDDEAAWQLTGGGWLYVLRGAAAAARGIELGPVETVAGNVHTTWITDPDGNRVQIGEPG